jgi:hypothetical protein
MEADWVWNLRDLISGVLIEGGHKDSSPQKVVINWWRRMGGGVGEW